MTGFREAAAVVLLREHEGELQVFLARRARHLRFLGGFHAFPGGTLDAGDHELASEGLVDDAHHAAAQRELFEELGVFLAPIDISEQERTRLHERSMQDPGGWPQWVRSRGGLPEVDFLPLGRWTTPPFSKHRFDARYLAAWLPPRETPKIVSSENDEGVWRTPRQALKEHERGELFISYPVLETLKVLARGSLSEAATELQNRPETYPQAGGEFLAGVHIVPLETPTLPPATHTNTYIIGRDELVVVDPGSPYAAEQARLIAYLEQLQADGRQLREIWLTHHHPDHIGGATAIREHFGIPIAAHAQTVALLEDQLPIQRAIPDGELTCFGDHIQDRWRALHTPGHAPGHLCFYEERLGTLLSGDLVLSVSTVVIAAPDGDMSAYFGSLERVLALPRHGFLFPAHGPPVAAATEAVINTLQHRKDRESAIVDALEDPRDAGEIVDIVYDGLNDAVRGLAIATVESHLRNLEAAGQVQSIQGGRWRRTPRKSHPGRL